MRPRKLCLSLTMVAATAVAGIQPAWATCRYQMVALLNGMQEVPPNASVGFGAGRFFIDTQANTLTYYIVYSGLSAAETAAHIHGPADPGVNAGVLVGLPLGNVKTGVWNYPEAAEQDILNGRTYVNVHTSNFPGGEIRGQIVTMVADLDGNQEVPPVPTAGRGFGLFTVNTDTNTIRYYIAFGGLGAAETAAHIHGLAPHGVNAGVMIGLPLGSPKVGVANYNEADEKAILRGMTYVNVHSANFPGGEIRGQITPNLIPMDGTQEVPPVPSGAAGVQLLVLDEAGDRLTFDIRHNVASETAAHFHGFAPPGVNAGVLFGLPAPAPRKLGTWAYAAAQEDNIRAGLTYTNIHSTAFPGGEVRGQNVWARLPCIGDIDGNGVVGQGDLGILLGAFGKSAGDAGYDACADLDGNDNIGQGDLGLLLSNFGINCP